jgi:hypothetical protein
MTSTYKAKHPRTRGREPVADKIHSTKSRGMPFGTICEHYHKKNDFGNILASYGFASKWDVMEQAGKIMTGRAR